MGEPIRLHRNRIVLVLVLVGVLALLVVVASAGRVGVVSYVASTTLSHTSGGVTFQGHLTPSQTPCSSSVPLSCRHQGGGPRRVSPIATWLGLAIGLMLVVGSLVLYLKTRDGQGPPGEELEVAAMPSATPRARRRPRNPREAVLAAFGELEDRLAAAGVGRLPAEGADSYLRRALPAHWRTSSAKSTLVRWYAVARFSEHPIDSEAARQAVAAAAELAIGTFGDKGEDAAAPGTL